MIKNDSPSVFRSCSHCRTVQKACFTANGRLFRGREDLYHWFVWTYGSNVKAVPICQGWLLENDWNGDLARHTKALLAIQTDSTENSFSFLSKMYRDYWTTWTDWFERRIHVLLRFDTLQMFEMFLWSGFDVVVIWISKWTQERFVWSDISAHILWALIVDHPHFKSWIFIVIIISPVVVRYQFRQIIYEFTSQLFNLNNNKI